MNYYYDVVVNFQEKNYRFYEWNENDEIEIIKKIPIFYVNAKTIKDIINNQIEVNSSFLEQIKNKTEAKEKKLEYVALFTTKNASIVLEFNKVGLAITRSYLQVEDECNILEILYTLPLYKLEYKIKNKIATINELRIEQELKKFLLIEIEELYKNKNIKKMQFLYNEWFKKDCNDINKIYLDIKEKLNHELTENEINIYNLIKLSHNNA